MEVDALEHIRGDEGDIVVKNHQLGKLRSAEACTLGEYAEVEGHIPL